MSNVITVWFTGLSGSGKSTLASALKKELRKKGHDSYMLDVDLIRQGLNKDLGFTNEAALRTSEELLK